MKFNQQSVCNSSVGQTIARALSVVALLVLTPYADATVINVNLLTVTGVATLNGTSWNSSVAPLSYTGSTWNDRVGVLGSGTDGTALLNSDGTPATGVSFTLAGVNDLDPGSGPLTMLQKDIRLYATGIGGFGTLTLTFSGLTASAYDFVLASDEANNFGGQFAVTTGITASLPQQTTFVQNETWALDVNYVEFDGIQPVDGQIAVTMSTEAYPSPYYIGALNGFQLESMIPEPSIGILFGIGAGILWLWRRNQR